MPSAPNEVQRRSSERSFIGIIVLAHTGRQLSENNGTDYFLSSLDLQIFRFTVCSLKLEHIVRNLETDVKTFIHKILKIKQVKR